MIDDNKYLVCVRCMTYNQVQYIEDTLNGFCMQRTQFPFVCVIVDDASTDGEQKVIKKYLQDNFDITDNKSLKYEDTDDYIMTFVQHKTNKYCNFAVFYLKYNHWGKKAKFPYYEKLFNKSKYIAICEGDDYWVDPLKLQRQVDFMEEHADYALCYTKSRRRYKNKIFGTWGDEAFTFESLLSGSIIPTLTRLERRTSYDTYIDEVKPNEHHWLMGDYANVLFYSLKSKIGYIDGYSAIYRVQEESSSHSKDIKKMLRFYDSADDIRYFIINEYIKDARYKEILCRIVKHNEVIYKLNLYTQRYLIREAFHLYKVEYDYLSEAERIKYWLQTFSEIISPIFIYIFNFKRSIKQLVKRIYISI